MFGLFKSKSEKKKREEEKKRLERLAKRVEILTNQRLKIYEKFDKYAKLSDNIVGEFCNMPNAENRANELDSKETPNIGWYKELYNEYVNEKNSLIREKHENEGLSCTYIVNFPEQNGVAGVTTVIPFTLIKTKPVGFNAELSNIEEVTSSLINTFFALEEEKGFMDGLAQLDKAGLFIGFDQDDEQKDYHFKFLRNGFMTLAIDSNYPYDSYLDENGMPLEEKDVESLLEGLDYIQDSVIFVLDELLKTVEQCLEFQDYIKELNATPADDFLTWLENNR